jgi:DNA-binding NarL/FixJ family response regulator
VAAVVTTGQAADPGRVQPIRVVVADDQDIVRDGLVTVLSLLPDIEVVGQARTGTEAVAQARLHLPDVVLMDLRMPELDGAGATAAIAAELPQVAVLVLTTYEDDASITRALTAGARGYLTKDASRHDIAAALRSVARGQSTFDPGVTARLVAGLTAATAQTDESGEPHGDRVGSTAGAAMATPQPGDSAVTLPELSGLTTREREVLVLIGEGANNAEIAERLFVSPATVKTHINNLFAKLQLRDRAQAVRLGAAHQAGSGGERHMTEREPSERERRRRYPPGAGPGN